MAGLGWQYVSIDTHVIGMIIRGATGREIPELMAEKLLTPLGLEAEPVYLTDGKGVAFVLEAEDPVNATLVKLRYFIGLTIPQAAEVLNISTATAERYWAYSRARLYQWITGQSSKQSGA